MEIREDKKCYNCAYFEHYYVKMEVGYRQTHMGHCRGNSYSGICRKKVDSNKDVCPKWKPIQINAKEKRGKICDVLLHAAKQINEMYFLLKEDEISEK